MVETRIDWREVWDALAVALDVHIGLGRRHLLTEDVVRFATVAVLADHGVTADRLAAERTVAGVGRIDLLVDPPGGAAIEFKFPREPSEKNAADTMALGELLRDFFRLQRLDATECWAVQLLRPKFQQFLRRRTEFRWTAEPGSEMNLPAGIREKLPASARNCLPDWATAPVTVTCDSARPLGEDLLVVYAVHPAGVAPESGSKA